MSDSRENKAEKRKNSRVLYVGAVKYYDNEKGLSYY